MLGVVWPHGLSAVLADPGIESAPDIGLVTVLGGVGVREFQRGAVRLHILHHAAEEEVHGAWMTEELARHGYDISPGTLYPTLHRLEADGLLTSRQLVVEGRARRLYRATRAGKAALKEDLRALDELAREMLDQQKP